MKRVRLRKVASLSLMVVLTMTACGGSSSSNTVATSAPPSTSPAASSGAPAAAPGPTITVQSFAFGAPVTVKPGAVVKVVNRDGTEHTVTSDDGTSFDVSASSGGTATLRAPSKAGTYKFHCSIHPDMHGTLVVAG